MHWSEIDILDKVSYIDSRWDFNGHDGVDGGYGFGLKWHEGSYLDFILAFY